MRYEIVFHRNNKATVYMTTGRAGKYGPVIKEKTMHYLTAMKWMSRQGIRWEWRELITGESSAYGTKEG